jgi:hypothetical protein
MSEDVRLLDHRRDCPPRLPHSDTSGSLVTIGCQKWQLVPDDMRIEVESTVAV